MHQLLGSKQAVGKCVLGGVPPSDGCASRRLVLQAERRLGRSPPGHGEGTLGAGPQRPVSSAGGKMFVRRRETVACGGSEAPPIITVALETFGTGGSSPSGNAESKPD